MKCFVFLRVLFLAFLTAAVSIYAHPLGVETAEALSVTERAESKSELIVSSTEDSSYKGVNDPLFLKAKDYFIKKNYKKAYESFSLAGKNGNSDAYFLMGIMHYCGFGVEHSIKLAKKYYTMASALGNVEAKFELAVRNLYIFTYQLVSKNPISEEEANKEYEQGKKLLLSAANSEHSQSQIIAAFMYINGDIDRNNYSQATKLLKAAAAKDSPDVYMALGAMYSDKKEYDEGIKYYTKGAENGSLLSLLLLEHNLILLGEQAWVKQDYTKAKKYYEMAIKNGVNDGPNQADLQDLATLIKDGKGTETAKIVEAKFSANNSGALSYNTKDTVEDYITKNNIRRVLKNYGL